MQYIKNDIRSFVQSCDSRICRKKYKSDLTKICDAVTTVHTFNTKTNEIICTECGKSRRLSK